MKFAFRNFLEKEKKLPKSFKGGLSLNKNHKNFKTSNYQDGFIEEATILIEDNLENSEFGLNTIMEHFHMSQSSLYKKIKSRTDLSPTEFIRSVRLMNAAKIIIEKESPKLNNVALEVGFNDYRYFKKSFKRYFGCLPSEFRSLVV